ncbi:MAG: glutamyl-tRNA reductase [Pseudomonadales bacterium]|nr:glutamyl-tRNA reductase [Pseudomonadales bacterium]
MDFLVVGINHNTAPVALREKVAFAPEHLGDALHDLKSTGGLKEIAILSTCNRTEIYAAANGPDPEPIVKWLAGFHDLSVDTLNESIYTHWQNDAIAHVIRVAVGLDSMVLGEPQILGQLKEGFFHAQSHGTLGPELNRLSQYTFRIAKKVRSDTAIGENPVSVAYTAVVLAQQLFSDFSRCNALMIGAGETIELAARHLQNAGVNNFVIANRTLANAEALAAKFGGTGIELSAIPSHLATTDILIASTASKLPILGKGSVERALKSRRHKPIFMVDLAVPRDIEPEIEELRDVYLYSIDDLQEIISDNLSTRQDAAEQAESIIRNAVTDYLQEYRSLQAVDTLVKFRKRHEVIMDAELNKAMERLHKGENPEKILNSFARQLTNKMIHTPSIQLKQAGADGREEILSAIQHLYQLDEQDDV